MDTESTASSASRVPILPERGIAADSLARIEWPEEWTTGRPGEALQEHPGVSYAAAVPSVPPGAVFMDDFMATVAQAIADLPEGAVVTELGGGANPALASHPRISSGNVRYIVVDISPVELAKGPEWVESIEADVAGPGVELPAPASLIVSTMLAEHVRGGDRMLVNVARWLAPGGRYIQVSPVLFALPFTLNRFLPERLADRVLTAVAPRDRERHAKFPARYELCRGPSARHLARYRAAGLEVVAARGYFGHGYYERVRALHRTHAAKSRALARHPVPLLCSFSVVVLERPGA